ncbi:hypothetical protein Hanom_Chr05g00392051 [Helianthus anomalus]
MASSSWTDVEDIALVEAWEEVYTDPPRRGQGVYGSVCNNILHNSVVRSRTVDALSSRFRVIRLDCEKFERYDKIVEDSSQDLGEEDIKAVALINYRHKEGHDFEHVTQWKMMRVWL